jgi:hypothetical protein
LRAVDDGLSYRVDSCDEWSNKDGLHPQPCMSIT